MFIPQASPPSGTQPSILTPDLLPRTQTYIRGIDPHYKVPELNLGTFTLNPESSPVSCAQTSIQSPELHLGLKPTYQDQEVGLGTQTSNPEFSSVLGAPTSTWGPYPQPGLRPTSGFHTFRPGPVVHLEPRPQTQNPVLYQGPRPSSQSQTFIWGPDLQPRPPDVGESSELHGFVINHTHDNMNKH